MMQPYNEEFINSLREKLKKKRKPINLKIQNQYIPLTLTKSAQLKLINKGFVALTLNDLQRLIKGCKTKDQQRQKVLTKAKAIKEGIKIADKVKEIFKGVITNFR